MHRYVNVFFGWPEQTWPIPSFSVKCVPHPVVSMATGACMHTEQVSLPLAIFRAHYVMDSHGCVFTPKEASKACMRTWHQQVAVHPCMPRSVRRIRVHVLASRCPTAVLWVLCCSTFQVTTLLPWSTSIAAHGWPWDCRCLWSTCVSASRFHVVIVLSSGRPALATVERTSSGCPATVIVVAIQLG